MKYVRWHRATDLVMASLVLALCIVPGAFGQANRFDYDDDAIRGLRYAAWEAGTIIGSAASPYSRSDLALSLDRSALFTGALSTEARLALERVAVMLASGFQLDSLGFGATIGATTTLEAYPRLYGGKEPGTSWAWADRRPILSIPIELGALGALYAKYIVDIQEDHNAIERIVDPANDSNWIESLDYVDYTFPFESFVAAEYGPLSFSVGRDRLRWGPGRTGTLVLSDAPDYYDYLDAGLGGEWFSYRFARVSIDPSLRPGEVIDAGAMAAKNLFLHRFEALLGGRVALALVEGLMVGGVEPELAYANPFLILHNRFAWNATSFVSAASVLGLELRFNPWRYMELYGSFAMNQLQTSYERERYEGDADAIPDAYAWLAGGEGAYPFMGGWIRASLEYAFTNPWMYIRENRLTSFTWRRRLTSNVAGADQLCDSFIGYRYGPDARVYYGALGWDAPGMLSFQASVEYAERGEQGLYTEYKEGDAALALTTPTGIVERSSNLGFEVSWCPRHGIDVYGALELRFVDNAGQQSGVSATVLDGRLGCTVSFPEVVRDGRARVGFKELP